MRLATTLLSLFLTLIVGAQSCTVYVGSAALGDQQTSEGGSLGILVALLFLVGGAFAIPFPTVSVIAFGLAALVAFAAGATSDFADMTVWGAAAVILAVMAFFGRREKRRKAAPLSP